MHILLVEDNEGDIELISRAFKKTQSGITLAIVHDGFEALDYLGKRDPYTKAIRPDLILLDLNTPRMDGRRFLEIAKQDENFCAIPVVVLTSSNAPADINDAYQRHANCYVLKPFNFDKFVAFAQQIDSFWGNLVRLPIKDDAIAVSNI